MFPSFRKKNEAPPNTRDYTVPFFVSLSRMVQIEFPSKSFVLCRIFTSHPYSRFACFTLKEEKGLDLSNKEEKETFWNKNQQTKTVPFFQTIKRMIENFLCFHLSLSVCLYIPQYVCLSACLSVCLPVCLSVSFMCVTFSGCTLPFVCKITFCFCMFVFLSFSFVYLSLYLQFWYSLIFSV